ncbi:MAG TPA: tol-pal system protein YbgF [Thermoanaerobaculia bacterium]|jgi:tol-pal system protein YbgF
MLRLLVLSAVALAAAGCVSTSDFEAAQRQIAELQEELANVKRTAAGKQDVQNVNTRIAEQTETLLKSNATLVAKVAEIDDRIATTQGGVEQANYRMDRLAQQVSEVQRGFTSLEARVNALATAPAPTSVVPAPADPAGTPAGGQMTVPAPANENPNDTYQAAYRDYQRGNFDLAIEGFRDFLRAAPNSDLADNAAYWMGESLFSQKKYREAIAQFDSVVTRFPRSDKVPGALLKKGYAYISVGERAQGIVQLQYVVHEHPKSQEASLARQRLKQLGIDTN